MNFLVEIGSVQCGLHGLLTPESHILRRAHYHKRILVLKFLKCSYWLTKKLI